MTGPRPGPTTDTPAASVGERLLDALVVLAVLALVVSIFDVSFTTRFYFVVAMVPATLAVGLALALGGTDRAAWFYAMVLLVLYAPVGALLALRDPGRYLFPDLATMGRVLGETPIAPIELASTLPPVEDGGTVLLVPYLLGYLIGGVASWCALGTRSAFAPVVCLLAGLGATIYLGSAAPHALLARSVAVVAICVWWASVRRNRGDSSGAQVTRGAWAQPIAAAVLVTLVATVVGTVIPVQSPTDRVVLRGNGLSSDQLADLDDPRDLESPRRRELLRATGIPRGVPVRFAALDTYDGTDWVAAARSPGGDAEGSFQRIGEQVNPRSTGSETTIEIQLRPDYVGDWLPMVGELASIDLDYTGGRSQLSQVRYNQVTGSALVVGGVDPRDNYTMRVVIGDHRLADTDQAHPAVEGQRQEAGAFLDPYLRQFRRDGWSPMQRFQVFLAYLRDNGIVDLKGTGTMRPDDLGPGFLGGRRIKGNLHQYGGLVALAASRLGVPARLVIGAWPDRRGRVFTNQVESWVEVQVADGSWRILRRPSYIGRLPNGPVDQEPAPEPTRDWLQDHDSSLPAPAPPATSTSVPERGELARGLGITALIVVAAGWLALLVVPVLKAVRRWRRRRSGRWVEVFIGGWQEVLDEARDVGREVSDDRGRLAQARDLGRGLELARTADVAVFAPIDVGAAQSGAYWAEAQRLRREVSRSAPRWRRAWAPFNPASLVAGWRRHRRPAR